MALVVAVSLSWHCGNECEFAERCVGNQREVCGGGVDQCIGRRAHREPCEGATPLCVELTEREAVCMAEKPPPCDPAAFETRCDGEVLEECLGGHLIRTDCAAGNRVCANGDGAAAGCAWPEPAADTAR